MRDWSELAGCRLAGLGVKSAAVLAMVFKCLPLPSDLAVLWPLLSTLLLPLALFGEVEESTRCSKLHTHLHWAGHGRRRWRVFPVTLPKPRRA